MHHEPDVLGERQQSLAEPLEQRERLRRRRRACRDCRTRASCAFACSAPFSTSSRSRSRMAQVEHAHAAARDLVLVRRPDAATRRADRLARRALAVDQLVIRQHEVRAVAHVEPALDVDAVVDEPVDLGEQRVRIEHDAVADRAAHARVQDAARDLVQHERRVAEVARCGRRSRRPGSAPPSRRARRARRRACPSPRRPTGRRRRRRVRFRTEHVAPVRGVCRKKTPRGCAGRWFNLRARGRR